MSLYRKGGLIYKSEKDKNRVSEEIKQINRLSLRGSDGEFYGKTDSCS